MDTMIVYKIQNLIDGKIYIGQTVFTFKKRYGGGKWWKTTSCKHLKNAAQKYGHENFSVEILERNVKTTEEMDELERFYIKSFDCMEPKGYNINSGGENRHFYSREQRIISAKARRGSDFAEIKNQLTGEVLKIENVNEFCEKNDYSSGSICDVLKGNIISYKYWTLPSVTMRYWILRNEDGREEKVVENDGRKFCIKHGLKIRDFEQMILGFDRGGWRVVFFQPRIGWIPKKQKPRTHVKTKFLNNFLSGEELKREYFYVRDLQTGLISKFKIEYASSKRVIAFYNLKITRNLSNIFLEKKTLFLKKRLYLVDENGKPILLEMMEKSKCKLARKVVEDFYLTNP